MKLFNTPFPKKYINLISIICAIFKKNFEIKGEINDDQMR